MKFQFQYFQSGRNMTVVSTKISLPNNQIVQQFRESIWNAVIDNFSTNKELSFSFLQSYDVGLLGSLDEILEFDLPFILQIANKHLSKENFHHCRWIHNQLHRYTRKSIKHSSFALLKRHFTNKLYEEYLILDYNQLRDKQEYEFDDLKEYSALKENQIRSSFKFNSKQDVEEFYKTFLKLKVNAGNDWFYNQAFEYVLDENAKNDFSYGIHLLEEIMRNDNEIEYSPFKYFKNILINIEQSDQIWEVINKYEYKQKPSWLLSFFIYLSEDIITSEHPDQILEVVKSIDESTSFHINEMLKYVKFKETLLLDVLSIIVDKNNLGGNKIWLQKGLFDVYFSHFKDDLKLVKRAYIHQYKIDDHFDYSNEGMLNILKEDINFLYEFFDYLKNDKDMKLHSLHNSMSFVWELDGIEDQILKILELVMKDEMYFGFTEHISNVFFKRLSDSHKERANKFILSLIELFKSDTKKMNIIFDVIRNSRRNLFETALLKYLSLNQDKDQFSEIHWRSPSSVSLGDVIFAEEEAGEWSSILKIVEKSQIGIKLLPIKKFISDRIQSCAVAAEWERRMKFLSRF